MLKKPLTFEQQINRLSEHGINVQNRTKAKEILSYVNYYKLTGYALSFRKSPSDSDCVAGTTLEKVYKLYCFDKELRYILRKYLEITEIYYKTQIGHWFSLTKCLNPPHDQHYDPDNYYKKDYFESIINSFERERDNYYKDSLIVKHHKANYGGQMPIWVMLELLSFSNTSKLYSSMYRSEQDRIANAIGVGSPTLRNHLHCLSVLRNKCAHVARLYDTTLYPSIKFGDNFLRKNPAVKSDTVFAYILMLIKRLPTSEHRQQLFDDLQSLLGDYKNNIEFEKIGFPDNYEQVLRNNI